MLLHKGMKNIRSTTIVSFNNNVLSVQSHDLMLHHVCMCCMCYNQYACASAIILQ